MKLTIDHDDCEELTHVDRDGVCQVPGGSQGFDVLLGGIHLHFEDENDAQRMAVLICERLGLATN